MYRFPHKDLNSHQGNIDFMKDALKQISVYLFDQTSLYKLEIRSLLIWLTMFFYLIFFNVIFIYNLYSAVNPYWAYNYLHQYTFTNCFLHCFDNDFECYEPNSTPFTYYPITWLIGRVNHTFNSQWESDFIEAHMYWLGRGKWTLYSAYWEPIFFGVHEFIVSYELTTFNINFAYSTMFREDRFDFFKFWLKNPNLEFFTDLVEKIINNSHRNLRRFPHRVLEQFSDSHNLTDVELNLNYDKFLFHSLMYEFNSVSFKGYRDVKELEQINLALMQFKEVCSGTIIKSKMYEYFEELNITFQELLLCRQNSKLITIQSEPMENLFNILFDKAKKYAKTNVINNFSKNFDLLQDRVLPLSLYNEAYPYINIHRLTTKYVLLQDSSINKFFF